MNIIEEAKKQGRTSLSEFEAKQILSSYKIPITKEMLVRSSEELFDATKKIGYPVVLKGCSSDITHKTEKGLVQLDIRNDEDAESVFNDIISSMGSDNGSVLVQEMVSGKRELVAGLVRDPQFGPCVMFGLGGIFTEVLSDVSFRLAPLKKRDAMEMMGEIKGHKILNAIRGMKEVDRDTLSQILINVGQIGLENESIKEIDINPLIISDGKPVAVDALLVIQ